MVAIVNRLAEERTDLSSVQIERCHQIAGDWALLADLSASDLVMWLPTWNDGGLIAVAQVRATTAPTNVPKDLVGTFLARGRSQHVDQALALGRVSTSADDTLVAYPVRDGQKVIAVVERYRAPSRRVTGELEEVYLRTAEDLFAMMVEGSYPAAELVTGASGTPRVGDGLIRVAADGQVRFASPNAVSAMHRLGLATELFGARLADLVVKLSHRHGPVDESLAEVAAGRVAGRADLDNGVATVLIRSIPIHHEGQHSGAVILLQDATEIRRRERALMSKDATIREIHHRVKNNLQTVAALLRLQARRATTTETRDALGEAQLRIAAIAVVHESLSRTGAEPAVFEEIVDRIVMLVRDLAGAYSPNGSVPEISRSGSGVSVPEEFVTPLAMVVSELLHNAVEHAGASRIRVELQVQADGLDLHVLDDGTGLPEGFTIAQAGLGLQIVDSLVSNEMHGHFHLTSPENGGTVAQVGVSWQSVAD